MEIHTPTHTPPVASMARIHPPHPVYICPACAQPLYQVESTLLCEHCHAVYPIVDGIVDFVGMEAFEGRVKPWFLGFVNWLAGIYETPLWYNVVLKLYGGRDAPTFKRIIPLMHDLLGVSKGVILDAACGPGTWGRRVASEDLSVYGIDLTMGMLQQGQELVRRDHIPNVWFSHNVVEALPFRDGQFDGAYCGGALHLFPEPVAALKEIARVLRPGAPLVALTFAFGNQGVLRFRRFIEPRLALRRLHVFDVDEMLEYLTESGFTDFEPHLYGSLFVFRARKAW